MHDPVARAKAFAHDIIEKACGQAVQNGQLPDVPLPDFVVEIPADNSQGDFAANIALVGAKAFKMAPRAIAETIVTNADLGGFFSGVDIAGPGFINFTLAGSYYCDVVAQVLKNGADYGRTDVGGGEKTMVEFVSANPTGPMHLGNARGGALGDCIAAVLDWSGSAVTREFYVNDAGNQIQKFALSLEARYLQLYRDDVVLPEDCYQGEDIVEHAKAFAEEVGDAYVDAAPEDRRQALVDYALPLNIQKLKEDLHLYRVDFDVWFSESSLHKDGTVLKVVEVLKERGCTYEKDGALWYKATDFGGEKDEVLIKSNGFYTYFAVDLAYHYNKFVVRGFDRVINCWGADHHGHVARMKGAMDALGIGGERLDIVLYQLVNLVRDGQPVRMSKRTGKSITLTDLLEEIPIDAARFYFNYRESNSHFDFDLDLAVKQSSDNPVFYVQYAHARICSIIRALAEDGIQLQDYEVCNLTLLEQPDEKALIAHLAKFPGEIVTAAREREPARITRYTVELATAFHKFYTTCRVKCASQDLCLARTALCIATKQALENALGILKITAPETM